ncbi:hypothetical protein USB125703_01111 [Pseudoclavibacter triregionum]|nr:hypothetical protein USB125703_01111 [Pseudoclavibacter triregionum]
MSSARICRRKVAAFTRMTGPAPMTTVSTPAIAGPSRRAPLKDVEFSAIAFERSSGDTISETKAWRAGASSEATMPRPSAKA